MISVCIPVYRFFPEELLLALQAQARQASVPVEIVVFDDGSGPEWTSSLQSLQPLADQWMTSPENIGRSAARNALAKLAQYDYLLFLDNDVQVMHPNFLERYIDCLQLSTADKTVFVGGRSVAKTIPPEGSRLRYFYQRKVEKRAQQHPDAFRSFMSNNFLVAKSLLLEYPFPTHWKQYGYEDNRWAYLLQLAGIRFQWINNTILVGDTVADEVYLLQIEEAAHQLAKAVKTESDGVSFGASVSLSKWHARFRASIFAWVLPLCSSCTGLFRQLLLWMPRMTWLWHWLKLGYYHQAWRAAGGREREE